MQRKNTSFLKFGAEFILGVMLLPWVVWVTVSVFSSQRVEAVQETKYQAIIEKLDVIKSDMDFLKRNK